MKIGFLKDEVNLGTACNVVKIRIVLVVSLIYTLLEIVFLFKPKKEEGNKSILYV